jgi:5'-3' exonuclease
MGIYNFFKFFKGQFHSNIYRVNKSVKSEAFIDVDNLLIDMNGLFHTSAQKIFKYGSYKPTDGEVIVVHNIPRNHQRVFQDVCDSIETILHTVNPHKRLILCVDGPAPLAKQLQQSKRRYVSSLSREDDDKSFDSNCISPGTKFMDNMSKYIDWFIRGKLSEDPLWQNLEIIYSSDKVEAEGEHKLQSYIRKYGKRNESFMMHGLDSDLIMLALISHCPKFYILRDDTFDRTNNFLLVDIAKIRPQIIEMMRWESAVMDHDDKPLYRFDEIWAINDFVFLCFMVGNDFLQHIPALEIVEGGIQVIIDCCKQVSSENGHITRHLNGKVTFSNKCLASFLDVISNFERELLERKVRHKQFYFPDETLTDSIIIDDKTKTYHVDVERYRHLYCLKHFQGVEMDSICHEYLDGLQWVLHYYTTGVPDWNWYFPFHYTPPAKVLAMSMSSYKPKVWRRNKPMLPFQQLLNILPAKSCNLLPKPFDEELKSIKPLTQDIKIDLCGKRYEYQGIVLLPLTNTKVVMNLYNKHYEAVDSNDKRRNYLGKTSVYKYDPACSKLFKSFYGNFYSKVNTTNIEI